MIGEDEGEEEVGRRDGGVDVVGRVRGEGEDRGEEDVGRLAGGARPEREGGGAEAGAAGGAHRGDEGVPRLRGQLPPRRPPPQHRPPPRCPPGLFPFPPSIFLYSDMRTRDRNRARVSSPSSSSSFLFPVELCGPIDRSHSVALISQADGCVFLAMEFCAGGNLADYIRQHGAICEQVSRNFMRQLGGAPPQPGSENQTPSPCFFDLNEFI